MLIRFSARNHLSIWEPQEISCVASTAIDDLPHAVTVDTPRLKGSAPLSLLPVLTLYGANAAGKSNMLHALLFFKRCIRDSFLKWEKLEKLPHPYFRLNADGARTPSEYDCDVLIEGVRYQYGFSICAEGVVKEWLYYYPKGQRSIVFQRDFSEEPELVKEGFYFGPAMRPTEKIWTEQASSRKTLLLSVAGKTEKESLTTVFRYFSDECRVIKLSGSLPEAAIGERIEACEEREQLEAILREADVGFVKLHLARAPLDDSKKRVYRTIEEMLSRISADLGMNQGEPLTLEFEKEDEVSIEVEHMGSNRTTYRIPFDLESTGTKHLIELLVQVVKALHAGSVLIVDEITTNLHTNMSAMIVRLFTSKLTNKKGAQFIFSTHDTNLLSRNLLRRDEVWFVEKNPEGATIVYPLTDFKTRRTENVEKGYLEGRFGAIPFVGNIESLLI